MACRSVAATAPDSSNPMLSVAYKAAAELHFTLLLLQQQQQLLLRHQQGSADSATTAAQGSAGVSGQELVSQVHLSLQSRRYEVRGAVLKVLLKHLRQHQQQWAELGGIGGGGGGAAADLCRLLAVHLPQEAHHKVKRRVLALLALLPLLSSPSESLTVTGGVPTPSSAEGGRALGTNSKDSSSSSLLFADVLRRAQADGDPVARQHAVECLGPLLAALLAQGGDNTREPSNSNCGSTGASTPRTTAGTGLEAVRAVLDVVKECSLPHQLPELRLASARALHTSGLLRFDRAFLSGSGASSQQQDEATDAAVAACAAAVTLLEDDDGMVREAAAEAVAEAVAAAATLAAAAGHAVPEAGARRHQRLQQQLSCEAAEAMAFELMPARFGPHPALLAQLCAWCCPLAWQRAALGLGANRSSHGSSSSSRTPVDPCGPVPAPAEEPAASAALGAAPEGIAVGRIFDKEADNQHQEALFICQLAAAALAQLLGDLARCSDGQPAEAAAAPALIRGWLDQALLLLESLQPVGASAENASGRGGVASGGGKAAARFRALAQSWLAVWVAGHLAEPRSAPTGGWRQGVLARIEPLARAAAREREGQPQLAQVAGAAVVAWGGQGSSRTPKPVATFLL